MTTRCPCSSGLTYSECCEPIHRGTVEAPTAERLMRSRYSAFALNDAAWLLRSWHASTRPKFLELDADRRWLGLEIVGRTRGGMLDTVGTVEFLAHFSDDDVRGSQRENSSFVRENHHWLYLAEV